MRATLTYNLDDEGDAFNYECAMKGKDLWFAITDLDEELRKIIKYGDGQYTEAEIDFAEKLRTKWHEIRAERDAYVTEG